MTTTVLQPLALELALPWSPNQQQEERFARWTKRTFILVGLLYLVIPWLPYYEAEYVAPEKPIVRTKVILESIKPPPLKPVEIKQPDKPQVKEIVKPKPVKPIEKSNLADKKSPVPVKPKATKESLSRSTGLASLSSQLTALRGTTNVAGMKTKQTVTDAKGTVATLDRDILGENRATQASLGVSVDEKLMKSNSSQLSGHITSVVAGDASAGDINGTEDYANYIGGQRDGESVKRELDRNKGSFYSIYYEALNQYPELHGVFIFEMVIEPSGVISQIKLVNSELGIPSLENNILNRIKVINFGVQDVTTTRFEMKYKFIPS